MVAVSLNYSTWKSEVQAKSWTTYHSLSDSNAVRIFSGTVDNQVLSLARGADKTDFDTNFPNSVLVAGFDEALYKIYKYITPSLQNRESDGSLMVSVTGKSLLGGVLGKMHMDQWSSTSSITTSSFKTSYENTTGGVFYDSVWQVSSSQMEVKISINSEILLQIELQELSNDFQMSTGIINMGYWIYEYFPQRWRFIPPDPIAFSDFKVEFKALSGSRSVTRGITTWREPV